MKLLRFKTPSFWRPYRSRIGRWRMQCFSKDYKATMKMFQTWVKRGRTCCGYSDAVLGTARFTEKIYLSEHFHVGRGFNGMWAEGGFRFFTSLCKNEGCAHKITIQFLEIGNNYQLYAIVFFYEEKSDADPFLHVITRKRFYFGGEDSETEFSPTVPVLSNVA